MGVHKQLSPPHPRTWPVPSKPSMLKHSLPLLILLVLLAACGGSKPSPTPTDAPPPAFVNPPEIFVPTPPSSLLTRIASKPATEALAPTQTSPEATLGPTSIGPTITLIPVPTLTPTPVQPVPTDRVPTRGPTPTGPASATITPTTAPTPGPGTPTPGAATPGPSPIVPDPLTPTPTSAPTETPTVMPTDGPTPTATITPTPSPTVPPATPTPRPTPISTAQPDWTLEFEVLSTPRNIAGTSNMFMGINNFCPGTGCSGDAFPPNPGILAYQVYLCHPPTGKINCDGERKLTSSWKPPTEVQVWVLEATYPRQMDEIEIAWRPQVLPSGLSLHIFPTGQGGNQIEMTSLSQGPRSFVLNMGLNVSRNILICSRAQGIPQSRCFE